MLATEWSLGSVIWAMVVFFFWFMMIWIFIALFADIFRRNDIHGWAKAGWILLIFIVPFLGALIYIIARPKMTEQDQQIMAEAAAAQGYSTAEEIQRLAQLRDSGKITAEEYEALKKKAMA